MTWSPRAVPSAWRPVLAFAFGIAALALILGSCAKKITRVDPSFTMPEGRPSPDAQLVAWYDTPLALLAFVDKPNTTVGPANDECCCGSHRLLRDPGDSLASVPPLTINPAGSVNTLIFDRTLATAFRPLRREANGGFRATLDHSLFPARRWLESKWETYTYLDPAPSGFRPPTYVARGEVSGTESAGSPLTNPGVIRQDAPGDIVYAGKCRPCDSLFTLRWNPVPGAARYWLHVYQLQSSASDQDRIRAAFASPINLVRSQDILVAYVDPPATSYRLGDTTRTDVQRLTERVWGWPQDNRPRFEQLYFVRVAAVDASGQLIAYTRGDYGRTDLLPPGHPGSPRYYYLYPLGANMVFPHRNRRRDGPSPPCEPETYVDLSASSSLARAPHHR